MDDFYVKFLGNYFGYGPSYDGSVFEKKNISPTLLASNANGNVPKIIVKVKNEK